MFICKPDNKECGEGCGKTFDSITDLFKHYLTCSEVITEYQPSSIEDAKDEELYRDIIDLVIEEGEIKESDLHYICDEAQMFKDFNEFTKDTEQKRDYYWARWGDGEVSKISKDKLQGTSYCSDDTDFAGVLDQNNKKVIYSPYCECNWADIADERKNKPVILQWVEGYGYMCGLEIEHI